MEWLWYSFAAALSRTVKDIGFKYVLGDEANTVEAVLAFWLVILICLLPVAVTLATYLRQAGKPLVRDRRQAWIGVLGSGAIDTVAYWMFLEALRGADFSVVTALRNTVPFFAVFTGALFLGEKMTRYRIAAALAVVAGILVIHQINLVSVVSYSSLLAMGSAALFSISIIFNRFGVAPKKGGMPAILYSTGLMTTSTILYGFWVAAAGSFSLVGEIFVRIATSPVLLVVIGVLGACGTVFTAKAFSVGEVTDVVPALRLQVLLSVLLGGSFYHEEGLIVRLAGALLIFAGLIVIARAPKYELKPQAA